MRYILLCGTGEINGIPRQLVKVKGERLVDRTIRLLRSRGIKDIAISTRNTAAFSGCDAKIIEYDSSGDWVNAFYPTGEPVCYIFGDVFFSPDAIKKIVETPTDSIEFFASAPPFGSGYTRIWAEPFAFKVNDQKYFRECIETVKEYKRLHKWKREPIAWELWQVIKKTAINYINYRNYVVINDYTCDIDEEKDIAEIEEVMKPRYLIHACENRMWYVEDYLIPSMYEQGINTVDAWVDVDRDGNLQSCMQSFLDCESYGNTTWHLQDDVIISRDFAEKTQKYTNGIVCGFCCNRFELSKSYGMWYSFPCIHIPDHIASDCAKWFYTPKTQQQFAGYIHRGKCDDEIFMHYCRMNKFGYTNLNPNIVDHVDYLIGGSLTNAQRNYKITRSSYWKDDDLVKALEVKLAHR